MLLHRGELFRHAESCISKKCWTMLKNCQKGRKNGGKTAIWLGIIKFITYFNTYGTDTNTCGKNREDTERRFLKKKIKIIKKSKNCQKCRKNGEKWQYDGV